ncbi:hypothetical protein BDW74DRAFT_167787 [Aspergillus multicolor]|uniref:uncharacterized protein n=1 Tax=Aspergillus multicolor TaxID=41759 RepID=UPI003CCCA30B
MSGIGVGSLQPVNVPTDVKTPDTVRKEAAARSRRIFESYEKLHGILERHEETIQKRWAKRTRQQKLAVLLASWPNMTSAHRPDFELFWKASHCAREYDGISRDRFMFPYINQEDLLTSKALLLLLNARGRNPPSTFAVHDAAAMEIGNRTGNFSELNISFGEGKRNVRGHYYMKLADLTENTREYGKLVCDKHSTNAAGDSNQIDPRAGLLMLEAQERLLAFLLRCCKHILHDVLEDSSTEFPVLPEPVMKQKCDVAGYESLSVQAAEAPYRAPAPPDFSLIQSLLAARASALEDHLWALREDPEYFASYLVTASEHQMEQLKDFEGKDHPLLSQKLPWWTRVVSSLVGEAYLATEIMFEGSRLADKVARLQIKYEAQIVPSSDLPEDYLQALLHFRFFLDRVPDLLHGSLWHACHPSPPLRNFWTREPSRSISEGVHVWKNVKNVQKEDKVQQQVSWSLTFLSKDNQVLDIITTRILTDELERLVQSEPRARAMLTSYVAAVVGDLALLAQCAHQLDQYQPWARTWDDAVEKRQDALAAEYSKRFKAYSRYTESLTDDSLSGAGAICDPSGDKFYYPFEKRRTKETVDALRKAERNLDAVWAAIDRPLCTKSGNLRGTAAGKLLSLQNLLRRTPEWEGPGSENTRPGELTRRGFHNAYHPMSAIYTKLRGNAFVLSQLNEQARNAPQLLGTVDKSGKTSAAPLFAVDARALKVFRSLFFNPAVTTTPAEVTWNDFFHALTSVGFAALKMYCSAWHFKPKKPNLSVERSIQFTEPTGKLSATTIRVFGRRLNRAYGWDGSMFGLEK